MSKPSGSTGGAATIDRAGRIGDEAELDASTCSCCQTDALRVGSATMVAYRDRTPAEIRDIAVTERFDSESWSASKILHADNWRIEGCPVNGPALARNGERLLVVWPTAASGRVQLEYASRDASRAWSTARSIDIASSVGRVDAAPWRDGFLVSFIETQGDSTGVFVARIDTAGNVAVRRLVAPLAAGRASGNPRMAVSGSSAALVWLTAGGGVSIAVWQWHGTVNPTARPLTFGP